MSAQRLESRAVIGALYRRLNIDPQLGWVTKVSMMFQSDQPSEEYAWLGMVPAMREWIGGRQPVGFRDNGITIENKHYEATIEVLIDQLRRDKSGQLMLRINELARRSQTHWASLLSTLIINAESTACYDGQYFFDTDHVEGDSGTQSNDISVDISALPTSVHGAAATAPSTEEFQLSVVEGVKQILGFLDDKGEPMNEDASSFLIMVPLSLFPVATAAINTSEHSEAKVDLRERLGGMSLEVVANNRLTSWTDKFSVFRTDSETKALIRQSETDVNVSAIAEGSELEFNHKMHQYGIDTWRNVGYGFWQDACLVTMV